MQTYNLSLHTPLYQGVGQKAKHFVTESTHVAYQVKECKIEHHASTYPVLKYSFGPWGEVKRSNHFFLKVDMLQIKLKRMKLRAPCKHIY